MVGKVTGIVRPVADTTVQRREVLTSGMESQSQSGQTNTVQPQLPDREESSKRVQEDTWSKGNSKVLETFFHYLYLAFIPGLEFTKIFGTLYNGSPSIFRVWVGPSIYAQPWTTWLYYPNLPPVLGAPYSIFWIYFYRLIAWDPLFASLTLISIDLVFVAGIWRWKGFKTTIMYQSFSILFLLMFPTDMLIFWLVILAYKYRPFLLIAPIVKLPVGAPLWVWQWVWSSPYSIHNPENTLRYSLLAISWLGALVWQMRTRLSKLIFSLLNRIL